MATDPRRLLGWYVLAPFLFAAIGIYELLTLDATFAVIAFVIFGFGLWQAARFGPAAVRAIRKPLD